MRSSPENRLSRIDTQLDSLHQELWELGRRLPEWDYKSAVHGRRYRAIAERVVLSAKRLEVLVREHSRIK